MLLEGYEIRHGRQEAIGEGLFNLHDSSGALLAHEGFSAEGARCCFGSPLHGLFENNAFRKAFYEALRPEGLPEGHLSDPQSLFDAELDRLADEVSGSLDLEVFLAADQTGEIGRGVPPIHVP